MVSQAKVLASAHDVVLRDPSHFVPGELHRNAEQWKSIANAPSDILSYVVNRVDAWSFLTHFKGKFGNQFYDAPSPPHKIFPNSSSCLAFEDFVTDTILCRVDNGSLRFWGLVGEVEPPHLVMPITVEPTKPRMCHDERFLNLWVKDLPFSLDYLSDLPRYVGWGAVLTLEPGNVQYLRDYWCTEDRAKPIVVREALALRNALAASGSSLVGSRVEGHVDSLPVVLAWKNQGGRSKDLTAVIQSIYEICLKFNIILSLSHVPSAENVADPPSRVLSPNDCMLAAPAWRQVETRWGPHTFDLMALDSNTQRGADGQPLPHFTPWPSPNSSGMNVFAQRIGSEHNVYVFPPLALVGPLLRFLAPFSPNMTIIVPDILPRRFWWPVVSKRAYDSVCLGRKGALGVVLFPTADSGFAAKPLPWDLWAFRLWNI